MTDFCTLLDAYLDGTLSEDQAERFERHASECHDCELALDATLEMPLALLADDTCPPAVLASALAATEAEWLDAWSRELRGLAETPCPSAVLDAALRQTRRAPDRSPVRSSRRSAVRWAVGIAALIAIGLAWSLRTPTDHARPEIAQTPLPIPIDSGSAPAPLPDVSEVEEAPLTAQAPAPVPAPVEAHPPPASPTPTPTIDSEPTDQIAEVDDTTAPAPVDEDTPSSEAIEAARDDLALAFRLVDRAQTQARSAVRDEVGVLSTTIEQTLPF